MIESRTSEKINMTIIDSLATNDGWFVAFVQQDAAPTDPFVVTVHRAIDYL